MKVLKPSQLSLLTRPYEFERRFHLGISVLAFLPMEQETALLSEISMWKLAADALGPAGSLDAAMPKTTCEYLICGKAYPAGGRGPGCTVHAEVAQTQKSLLVLGDRVWAGGSFTEPIPFEEMPITWANAFGGEAIAANPQGKGHKPVLIGEQVIHPLPNIEDPRKPISSKRHKPEPAGFGPLDVTAPSRRRRAGTYKKKWQQNEFPGMASDIDWRFFNAAPDDQHLPSPWRGGDSYRFQNLHPTEAILQGQIPALETRCFLTRDTSPDTLEEIQTQLTTIWFFPHVKRMVLVYHGRADAREEDAADVATAMIAAELPDATRSISHYQQVHAKRMDLEQSGIEALNDPDLVPAGIAKPDPEIEAITAAMSPAAALHDQQNEQIDSAMEELPAAGESPDRGEEIDAESLQEESAALAALDDAPRGPPVPEAAAKQQQLETDLTQAEEQGDAATAGVIGAMLANEVLWNLEAEADEQAREAYRRDAQNQAPAEPLEGEAAAALREQAESRLSAARDLSGQDWTGADFSDLDLSGVSFAGAFCEAANFDNARLHGADFSGAVLTRARFAGARIDGANFEQANLALAALQEVHCDAPVNLRGAILDGLNLAGVRLHGSDLTGASIEGTLLRGADLAGIRAEGMMFDGLDLQGLNLAGAKLGLCLFTNCKVKGLNLTEADLTSAAFLTCNGAIDASQALLKQTVFVDDCNLDGSAFTAATLHKSCLRDTSLAEVNFTAAELLECDLGSANLRNSSFVGATARSCLFIKSQLQGADLKAANLRESIFMHAHVQGADFRRANLYMADLARIRADEKTQFDDAFFERVRTMPRYEPQA